MYDFTMYTGKSCGSLRSIIVSLVRSLKDRGTILVADNYFSTIALFKELHFQLGIRCVMTYTLRDRGADFLKTATQDNVPFGKMPASMANALPKGWMQTAKATFKVGAQSMELFMTRWRDTKLTCFLYNTMTGDQGVTASRRTSSGQRVANDSFAAAVFYALWYGAVDRVDKDLQFFPCDFRQVAHWQRRPVLWSIDCVVHNVWVLLQVHFAENGGSGVKPCYCQPASAFAAKPGDTHHDCFKDREGLSGRQKFQLDLSESILERASAEIAKLVQAGSPVVDPKPKTPGRKRKNDGTVQTRTTAKVPRKPATVQQPKRPRGRPLKHRFVKMYPTSMRCTACYQRLAERERDKPKKDRRTQTQLRADCSLKYCRTGCPACCDGKGVPVCRTCQDGFVHH